jgi:hypothetical protein
MIAIGEPKPSSKTQKMEMSINKNEKTAMLLFL